MSLLEKILPGSYKGVGFLMISGTTTGGPKVVKHEYPNSNTQTIETLGLIPRAYSVTIIIGGGDDYLTRRNQILRILEDESLGKLVHPLYGDIENVISLPYTLTENFDSLGEGRISVIFEVSEGTGVPQRTNNTLNTVENSHNSVLVSMNSSFVAGYSLPVNEPNTYTDALTKGQNVSAAFSSNSEVAQGVPDKIDDFNSAVSKFDSNITSLVDAPQDYADNIQSLFTKINGLYSESSDSVLVIEKFFTFGDDDVSLNLTTPSRISRKNNRDNLNGLIQAEALSYSYFSSSQLSFETVNDIDKRAAALEIQYQKVIVSEGIDGDTKELITELRLTVQQFFEAEKLAAQQVITVNTHMTSARLLAYAYYGNSVLGAQIAELNESTEPSFIEGAIDILSS